MSTQQELRAQNVALRNILSTANKHIRNMEMAIAHVLEERDHLRALCVILHDDTMRMQLEHDNEEIALQDAVSRLRYELNISLDEQVRLLAQRRILAKHLRGLMYLSRPATTDGWHLELVKTPVAPIHIDLCMTAYDCEYVQAPMLWERIVTWFRSITASRTTAA